MSGSDSDFTREPVCASTDIHSFVILASARSQATKQQNQGILAVLNSIF